MIFKQLVLLFAVTLLAVPGQAKKRYRIPAEQTKSQTATQRKNLSIAKKSNETQTSMANSSINQLNEKLWGKGSETVIHLKGQASEGSARCQSFQIEIKESLNYKIDCVGHEKEDVIDLVSGKNRTVTQKNGYLTITKYNYLLKKTQISRLQQSTLKVPYVEQIIHIKKQKNGQLSFYFESFREDEFGRIVQDGFIQAHSLTHKKMKISSN